MLFDSFWPGFLGYQDSSAFLFSCLGLVGCKDNDAVLFLLPRLCERGRGLPFYKDTHIKDNERVTEKEASAQKEASAAERTCDKGLASWLAGCGVSETTPSLGQSCIAAIPHMVKETFSKDGGS